MRILYILNATGGGASAGIYEMLRAKPPITAYAAVPLGNTDPMRDLFADARAIPLPWWNVRVEADPLRRLAMKAGDWRHGQTPALSRRAIINLIRDWKIDLVHTGTALTNTGALAAPHTGTPHIWHIKETIGRPNRVQFHLNDAQLIDYISKLSARVVVMSETIGAIFRQHDCPNLEVVPDGVDLQPYLNGDSRNLRARLNIQPDEYLVGMVAGLSSIWKRHDLFVRMAGILAERDPKIRFVLLGGIPAQTRFPYDVPYHYAQSILNLAAECVPEGRLQFWEHVPDPPDIMRSLDVLVHPCDIEPFGRIAIEAMAAGTPVVGPTTGGIAETVRADETGLLVPPGDVDALADATLRLLRDESLRQQMGQAGRNHVQQRYRIETYIERLMSLYSDILA